MASATDPIPANPQAGEVVPITSRGRQLPSCSSLEQPSRMDNIGERFGRSLGEAAYVVGCAYAEVQARISGTIAGAASKTRSLVRRMQDGLEQTKRERPFQLLGIVAAMAFLAGIAVRIWRRR